MAAIQAVTRKGMPRPRHAVLQRFLHPASGEPIDRGILLWFPGPQSFTGEDCCEFHVHGGSAVVTAMLDALQHVPGLRHAEPGQFTKRAFQHGKLDLTEVEGLADLIHAETEAQRRQALRQMEGGLSHLYHSWRKALIKCVAHVEAYIDFSEDDNIEDDVLDQVAVSVSQLAGDIQLHLQDNRRGERLRSGVRVAILGEPNVGKSSLLNIITQRPAAIVSPQAGTTRDVVETAVNLGGFPVLLSDTAGLRETQDVVEQEGVRRAKERMSQADVCVVVLDASSILQGHSDLSTSRDLHKCVMDHLGKLGLSSSRERNEFKNSQETTGNEGLLHHMKHVIVILNKIDLLDTDSREALEKRWAKQYEDIRENIQSTVVDGRPSVSHIQSSITDVKSSASDVVSPTSDLQSSISDVKSSISDAQSSTSDVQSSMLGIDVCHLSCLTEDGMDGFLTTLTSKVAQMCGDPSSGNPSLTQARHRRHLVAALEALQAYTVMVSTDVVIAAEQLQTAVRHIGKITGNVSSEEILDVIFRDFCIGK